MAKPAGSSTDVTERAIPHGVRITETRLRMDTSLFLVECPLAPNEDGAWRLDAEFF
jgi:hypothetical protein